MAISAMLHEWRCTCADTFSKSDSPYMREGYYIIAATEDEAIAKLKREVTAFKAHSSSYQATISRKNFCCAECKRPRLLCFCAKRRGK